VLLPLGETRGEPLSNVISGLTYLMVFKRVHISCVSMPFGNCPGAVMLGARCSAVWCCERDVLRIMVISVIGPVLEGRARYFSKFSKISEVSRVSVGGPLCITVSMPSHLDRRRLHPPYREQV
jgi:hypothetical protein